MATTYVKRIHWVVLHDHWGARAERLGDSIVYMPGMHMGQHYVYIRCDKFGEVKDWNKVKVYSLEELISKNDVQIVSM